MGNDYLSSEALNQENDFGTKYLTFWTDRQLFGIPVTDVVQIVEMQEITKVPEFPPYAKGVVNIRGNIVPVIDVRLRFGKEENTDIEYACIIIAAVGDQAVGFIADAVSDVSEIPFESITPAPEGFSSDIVNFFLWGIGRINDQVIFLMDTQKMVFEEDKTAIFSVNKRH